jgi:hypothetical protein
LAAEVGRSVLRPYKHLFGCFGEEDVADAACEHVKAGDLAFGIAAENDGCAKWALEFVGYR